MAFGKGFLTVGAYKKGTTWRTAVQAGALDGFEFLSESVSERAELLPDEEVSGSAFRRAGEAGNRVYAGDIVLNGRYRGLELFLAHALGACTTSQVSTTVYKSVFKPYSIREGQFGTLVFNKQTSIWEFASTKVTGFNVKVSQGGKAEWTFSVVASSLARNGATGTNNTTTIASVTVPTPRDIQLFSHMQAWVNLASGADFAGADLVYINDFELSVQQPFTSDDFSTKHGNEIEEPVADGKFEVKMKMGFRKLHDGEGGPNALQAYAAGKTKLKAKVKFTSAYNITGAYYNDMTFWLPEIQIEDHDAAVPGANVIPTSFNFAAHEATAAPTGFTAGYTQPVVIDLQNELTASPLD